jgi:CubicO group peptidase (beta-lactamase class C family)
MNQLHPDLLRDGVAYADRWIAYQQERREVPGIAVTISHGDQVLLAQGYGYADLERQTPMTSRHIFRIASHSKTFTATAILQLLERGKLRLDDPLASSIPWLGRLGDLAQVSIRQALNHSSGVIRDGLDAAYWHLERGFPDADELRRLVEDGGAVLAANERFKYSNIAYGLLGLVIEAASGTPYNQYVKEHIVDRLGLADTGPELDDHARTRLVKGYTSRHLGLPRRPIPDIDTRALSPATGFYSSAEDLSRYVSAHFLGDARLLRDASKREMQQPYWEVAQADERYGLGFDVVKIGERQLVGHGGGFPGHITRTLFDPVDRLAIVVLTNEIAGPARAIAHAVVRIIDFALKQPPATNHDGRHDRYVGRFVDLWGVTDVAAFGDALLALSPEGDDPTKDVTRLRVEDTDTLRITDTDGYGSPGESVRYSRDAEGRVTMVRFGGTPCYPPDLYRAHERGRTW